MDAAGLTLQMMTDVDCNSNAVNAELEVVKLQQLVRKLEKQNEQLRASAVNGCSTSPRIQTTSPACILDSRPVPGGYRLPSPLTALLCRSSFCPADDSFQYFLSHSAADAAVEAQGGEGEPTVLDEVALLDLDSMFSLDKSDDSWLYVSARARPWQRPLLSPLQWCRQVLDGLRGEGEASRRSQCLRQAPGTSAHPLLLTSLSPMVKDPERTPSFLTRPTSGLSAEQEADCVSLGYKLQDLTDVQVMARLQEESLRQDYASTSITRSSSSFCFQFSQQGEPHLQGEEQEERGSRKPGLPHSHTFSSLRDWRRSISSPQCPSSGSSQPSPPSSPCTPQLQAFRPGSDKLRRSMPSLVRVPSMPSVPNPANHTCSPSQLRNSQSFDSSNGLARLQACTSLAQSVVNFGALSRQPLKATAYVSPTVKGSVAMPTSTSLQSLIPNKATPPRSSLPHPASFVGSASRSRTSQPARSLLTPPKNLSALSALPDRSWRDGCY
ncbi:SLAIN motif-containing protein 1 isoform X2 [Osmerus eperlanus]|uniref:SLAIN motif-containing protein 1 isoform X2 n=1 Tax=Osmerus eperlanus TaxID=29151 RepID=UPI002E10798B